LPYSGHQLSSSKRRKHFETCLQSGSTEPVIDGDGPYGCPINPKLVDARVTRIDAAHDGESLGLFDK